ncbi:halocyanin domain-containing protein [Halobacteriales archaeon QS_9_67_17]|nr:MAG: halocyanin domain-containing protein [Halobacteriales archaeon QS_9_67_17]
MNTGETSRRRFLAAVTTVGASVALAGCSDGDGSGESDVNGGDYSAAEQRVVEYLTSDSETENFDGSFADETGADEVVIEVGAPGNGANYAYAPPAVTVSTGTTVSWEWTGDGGSHNVVSADGSDFELSSGNPQEQQEPFTRTFEERGVAVYYCSPHRTLGMKGGLVVE